MASGYCLPETRQTAWKGAILRRDRGFLMSSVGEVLPCSDRVGTGGRRFDSEDLVGSDRAPGHRKLGKSAKCERFRGLYAAHLLRMALRPF